MRSLLRRLRLRFYPLLRRFVSSFHLLIRLLLRFHLPAILTSRLGLIAVILDLPLRLLPDIRSLVA